MFLLMYLTNTSLLEMLYSFFIEVHITALSEYTTSCFLLVMKKKCQYSFIASVSNFYHEKSIFP